jgi:hypothetical protein
MPLVADAVHHDLDAGVEKLDDHHHEYAAYQ